MSIDTWAEKNGETPRAAISAEAWFAEHPDLREAATEAYKQGWAWPQIHRWLIEEHAYPLKDEKSVTKACR